MTLYEESTVGKKGEILPKKGIREYLNLNPGDHVIIEATPTEMVIKKIYSIEELLKMPRIGKGTPAEHKRLIREEIEEHEKHID
jgi:bifunctional DNA-binding transcriptional regulator/antitoxin component of YhaV-PrlF toxin-antitoxin module